MSAGDAPARREARPPLEGGCLCAGIRYRLAAEPSDAGYCHCTMCRRSSGAPALVFATVPLNALNWLRGEPKRYRSSDIGERGFCPDCGTPLFMRTDDEPDTIDFTVATLDRPDAIAPGFHIWRRSKIRWFETVDRLPRFDDFRTERS
jgi:hypothetical protein